MNYTGIIIEESLIDASVLKKVRIISTKVERVTQEHKTPWVTQWTMHTVEMSSQLVDYIASEISTVLDTEHPWYADFKNDTDHYIIFRNKVFHVSRSSKEEYDKVTTYGLELGIPDYQLDFSSHVKEWKR
jgi:hypothetical protein